MQPTWNKRSIIVDLSAFKGQTVRIVFRASCDESYPTTFRVDDVSLKVGN